MPRTIPAVAMPVWTPAFWASRARMMAMVPRIGWQMKPAPGAYGGYQAIQRWPGRYAAATEMRKDGVALGY